MDYGTLISLDIDELIEMKKRHSYLDKHPYAIWQSKDGKYWYTTLPDSTKERGVRQIRRNTRQELDDVIIEYWENHGNDKTIEEIFIEWNDNRLELKKILQSTYINLKYKFNSFFGGIRKRNIEDIKPIDWCDFLENSVVEFNLTTKEFNNVKSIAIGIIKWSYKRGYIDYPSSSVTDLLEISPNAFKNNKKEDKDEVYNEDETPLLINYFINNPSLRNLGLLLIFITGIRIGELVTLKHGDFVGNVLRIRRTVTRFIDETGKQFRGVKDNPKTMAGNRDIIVPSDYQWLMDKFSDGNPDEYIFINKNGGFFRYDGFVRHLKKACEEVGIPYRSPHKIRKTYISILLDNGLDSRFVIAQAGHTNISCAENFYHKERKNQEKKAEIIDSIPDFKRNITET